jgi:branched-chain amino acid transport system ATP-binding protein
MEREDGTILKLDEISLNFGGVNALVELNLEVRRGELLAIIGPNGAGKTCLINSIMGYYRPQRGQIYFQGKDITHLATHKRAAMGIARTFQNTALYPGMTALNNVLAGRHAHQKSGALTGALYFGWARKEEIEHRRRVEEIFDLLEMQPLRKKMVAMLPHGMRKRVELGRALAQEPKLLLLDEPASGMSVEEKEDMVRFILDISEEKETTIVLIEHDMGLVMDIADRIIVFNFGRKIAEGPPDEIKSNPEVITAYLGD